MLRTWQRFYQWNKGTVRRFGYCDCIMAFLVSQCIHLLCKTDRQRFWRIRNWISKFWPYCMQIIAIHFCHIQFDLYLYTPWNVEMVQRFDCSLYFMYHLRFPKTFLLWHIANATSIMGPFFEISIEEQRIMTFLSGHCSTKTKKEDFWHNLDDKWILIRVSSHSGLLYS